MMRVFKTRTFARSTRKLGLTDAALWAAVQEMSEGLVDATLGGDLLKQRVALSGQGKRGGARTIVAMRTAGRWFFLYGFNKNERSNIGKHELKVLQELAKELLAFEDRQLEIALSAGEIVEIINGDNKA
ncbi:type II toxin-antitoxin system RelE/ParE family toxin [Wenzhouxiangella limi]|uniref:Type II toxin-antitoxin system RelE/ParE family toxin n=1 Tax=Wenzhouxiangella limi TaxID=2707351 RepID=A0A845V4J6_9GAMM|nr:type II toxin-antitoxin system RelE/ParE family toxin [Wenzhouxiangella limi]NDY94885.1 type II toxin-antitoxin system RelE/ParE family toxin [Wenzhouxiangella limi]